VPRYSILHLRFDSHQRFPRDIAPALLIGRFLGRRIVLHYCRNQAVVELERFGWWLAPFLRLCDRVVVPAQYLADLLRRQGVGAHVIPYFLDPKVLPPRDITSVQPRMLVARSLEKRNNVACIVEAYAIVKQKYPRAELTIAGDGPERDNLEAQVRQERLTGVSFVHHAGPSGLADLLAEADVYVNASSIDGLPFSLTAAMAVGMPVVTTDAGGISEVLRDEENGLVFRSDDPAGLAEQIIRLIESPELVRRLSDRARESAANISQSATVRSWRSLFVGIAPYAGVEDSSLSTA
ncbi:MAG: glycosyltransferase family 4 protein, partial [Candidatus Zixiibacteriota bacterium]